MPQLSSIHEVVCPEFDVDAPYVRLPSDTTMGNVANQGIHAIVAFKKTAAFGTDRYTCACGLTFTRNKGKRLRVPHASEVGP